MIGRLRRLSTPLKTLAAAVTVQALCLVSVPAHAEQSPFFREATYECVKGASSLQGVPIPVIIGFLLTEGGHPGSQSRNKDGSYDLGPMQINDRAWLSTLARMHFGGNQALAREYIRYDGCYNVHIGTWIFKQALVEAHGNMRTAIGYYNSHNPEHMREYVNRYIQSIERIEALAHKHSISGSRPNG